MPFTRKPYLDHDEVLLDLSVVGESTHGVDGLVSNVIPVQITVKTIIPSPILKKLENLVRINSQDIFMAIKW